MDSRLSVRENRPAMPKIMVSSVKAASGKRDARNRKVVSQTVIAGPSVRWAEGWRALFLCALSGCLWFLACTPYNLWLLSWIAMVPALYVLDHCSTVRRAGLFCWAAGAVMIAGGFYWIIELLRRFADMPTPLARLIFVLFCGYQGITFFLFGLTVSFIRRHKRLPMALLAPLAMVTFEWLIPRLFPSYLAIMLAGHPLAIQTADLAGPLGVTALLLMVSGAVYDGLTERRRALKPALTAALILMAALLYGWMRMRHFDAAATSAPKLAVGVVQPNVAYNEKGVSHPEWARSQLADLQEQSRQLERAGAQLILWSEVAYPYELARDLRTDFAENDSRRIRRGFTTPTVVGALTREPGYPFSYNSALLLDRAGNVAGRYDKMRLLAFGEHIPAGETFPWLRDLVPPGFGSFLSGKEASPLPLAMPGQGDARLGAVICYEDILPEFLRQVGQHHPHLMVNLTNDTWFGEKAEPWEHLALARLASIEQRTGMVRAVNSGVSAFIDPNGRIIEQTYAVDPYIHPHPATASLASLPLLEGGHTVYAKVGNLFACLCAVATAILLLIKVYRNQVPFRSLRSTGVKHPIGGPRLQDASHKARLVAYRASSGLMSVKRTLTCWPPAREWLIALAARSIAETAIRHSSI